MTEAYEETASPSTEPGADVESTEASGVKPPSPVPPGEPLAVTPFIEAPKRKKTRLVIGIVALVLCIIVAVVLVVVLLGSSDKGQAINLMNKATPFMTDSQTKLNTLTTDLNSFKDATSAAQYETEEKKVRAEVKDIDSDLNNAQKYISQVSSLNGVQPYKDYAAVMSTFNRTVLKETAQVTQYLNYMDTPVKNIEAGQAVDSAAISARTSAFVLKMQELNAEATALKNKAENMYNNLEASSGGPSYVGTYTMTDGSKMVLDDTGVATITIPTGKQSATTTYSVKGKTVTLMNPQTGGVLVTFTFKNNTLTSTQGTSTEVWTKR